MFGLPAQAQAMLAIQQQKDGFTYRDNRFTLTKEAEDFYSVSRKWSGGGSCLQERGEPLRFGRHPVL